jgi:undecaprenyl-diphosphatase
MKKNTTIILLTTLTLFIILTILVITENAPVQAFNDGIYHHISKTIHPTLTSLSILIGSLTHWYTYAPVILLLIILPKTRFKAGVPMAVVLSVSAITGPVILKNVLAIERPNINPLVEIGGFGYPSGHSLNALVFFTALTILVWRYCNQKSTKNTAIILATIAILLVGLSRIYLGVHTVTDVLGGYLAGGAVLCGMILLENPIKDKVSSLMKK